jgi:hypothetical protein
VQYDRDEDGIETVTHAQLPLQPAHHAEQDEAARLAAWERPFNLCPKQAKGVQGVQGQARPEPMTLSTGEDTYTLRFDCKPCEMHVVGAMKPGILRMPPPSAVPYSPLTFHRRRPA